MRAHLFLLVALAIGGGCKKDKKASEPGAAPKAPASTADQDALWALTPDKAMVGVVVSPAGLARLEGGALEITKLFATAPDLAPFKAKMDQALQEVFGTTNPSLAAAGLTTQKGLAVFAVDGGEKPIMILPVADRDKFLALVKGTKGTDGDTIKKATCKTVKNVYACAQSPDLFDRLGKGSLAEQLKLAGARGDIEIAAAVPDPAVTVGAVVQLSRGSAVVRAGVKGIPDKVKPFLANTKPRTDGEKSAGFAVVNLAPYLPLLKAKAPAVPIVSGVALDELVRSIEGPLTMTIDNGALMFDVRLPLNDGAVAGRLLEQCDKLDPTGMIGPTFKDGTCHVAIPQTPFEIDAWVDGKTLRIGKQGAQSTAPAAAMSAVGKELAGGEWIFAMFGRGTLFGPSPMTIPLPPGQLPPEAMLGLRAFTVINELGFGVRVDGEVVRVVGTLRTLWANPDDVVAKLVAIDPREVMQGKAGAQGKAIADAAPQSPFAADYKTGMSGLMMPAFTVGLLAAVAIPAFMDYTKKSKRTEASLQLSRLEKNLEAAYIANAAFPKGTVAATPATPCCATGGMCMPDPAAWANPVWQELDFMIDEPHKFRYAYASTDGKTFVAKATGDLDCDGQEIEYVLAGGVDAAGNPTITIVEPPAGSD